MEKNKSRLFSLKNSLKTNKYLPAIIISLFFLTLILVCYPGLYVSFSNHVIRGDMGDLHNIMAIVSHTLHTSPSFWYHLPVFYPMSYTLTQTHPLFGVSIVFWMFHQLGFTMVQSINLYIILSLLLGAWGCYLLAREFMPDGFFPLLMSCLYIFYPLNHLHFVWLNFLSRFYLPFVLLFLIRYIKTKNKKYAFLTVLAALLQFFASVYYGVLLWILLLPLGLTALILLKIITLKHLRLLLILLAIGGVLILLMYYPYLANNTRTANHFDGKLTQVEELFASSPLLSLFWGDPEEIDQFLFPGFLFSAAILLFFIGKQPRVHWLAQIIPFLILPILCVLTYHHRTEANYIFLILIGLLIYFLFQRWKDLSQLIKWALILLVGMGCFLFQFSNPAFLKSLAPYRLVYTLLPVGGLTVIKRASIWLLPLLIVLACLGSNRFFPDLRQWTKKKRALVFILLLILIGGETIKNPARYLYKKGTKTVMKPIMGKIELYKHLPFKSNKVVLEIPFYFRRRLKNARYMLNWQFHQNPLLNGKVSIFPKEYTRTLSRNLGQYQIGFPSPEALRKCIQDYSVSYLVFHWDLLKEYQSIRRTPESKDIIHQRFKQLQAYSEILHLDSHGMVVRLQENFPQRQIIRTFSWYHLKKLRLNVKLKEPCSGTVKVWLNGQQVRSIKMKGKRLILDFTRHSFKQKKINSQTGIRVIIQFENDIYLASITLI